jgi:beta-fructofuranosidase
VTRPAPRPRLHYSTPRGWLNDPHGVTWHDGRYHVFFQYVPDGAAWTPQCRWGHAVAPDLTSWDDEVRIALAPGDGDGGCWSGTLVVDGGHPTIVYTGAGPPDWGHGRIRLAVGDPGMTGWTKLAPPVLEAPDGVAEFRDPSVHRAAAGWRMVGGGRRGGAAAAMLFGSRDLRRWTPGGVLCERAAGPDDPVPTGDAWECVQFLEIDGAWVLIASAWTHRVDDGVVYAVGTFDGAVFTPRTWRRLDHGGALYATTTFRDAEGRWCAMSWVREAEPPHPDRTRAGALSLPHRLAVDGDRLRFTPHPDVDRLRGAELPLDGPLPAQCELETAVPSPIVAGSLALAPDGDELLLTVGSSPARRLPVPAGTRVRIVLDEDIVEVFAGGELAVVRVPQRATALTAAPPDTRLHAMLGTSAT